MSLSPETIDIIKATAAPVSQHAEAITTRMYEILFEKYPETEPFFKDADADQHKKLAAAIGAYAANIDNLSVLDKAVEKIAKTHVDSKIMPEHYPMVGTASGCQRYSWQCRDRRGDRSLERGLLFSWRPSDCNREKTLYSGLTFSPKNPLYYLPKRRHIGTHQ